MKHDDIHGEQVAGWAHLAFSGLYLAALIWHFKGAMEHFERRKRFKAHGVKGKESGLLTWPSGHYEYFVD